MRRKEIKGIKYARVTKPVSVTPLNYSLKTVTLMIVYFGKKMKYLEENKIIYNKPTKNGNYFIFPKDILEIFSSPFH